MHVRVTNADGAAAQTAARIAPAPGSSASRTPSSPFRPHRHLAVPEAARSAARENSLTSPQSGRVGYALKVHSRTGKQQASRGSGGNPVSDNAKAWVTSNPVRRWLRLIVDSGSTWHVHNRLEDMSNVRKCFDTVVDASGKAIPCSHVGDLLLLVHDHRNRELRFWLKGVRYSPDLEDSLISVDQLWHTSKIDCVFRDVRSLVFESTPDATHGESLSIPFKRRQGLFCWDVGVLPPDWSTRQTAAAPLSSSRKALTARRPGHMRGLKHGIHAATSRSHVHSLPADEVAATLHRRLHVSLESIRRLGTRSSDAPEHVASATQITCAMCAEANSSRTPHGDSQYAPTHAGRLVHADIVGPFTNSFFGGSKYALLLVDDHTRFKFVYFLKDKSEAPKQAAKFLATLNAHASSKSASPIRVVGALHTDNAGEFLSRQFTELLDSEYVAQTTCPPHVHALNGVAERGIQSVMNLTRSYLTAGNVASSHWPYAVQMAVDVLNRTTGPPGSGAVGATSYELLTGDKPRVLGIMPFGCRAFAVKPRSQYSKTTIDPRAWVGVNLGRSSRSPGAYEILVPSTGRIVTTSDAYFEEGYYPFRPKGERQDELQVTPPPTSPVLDESQPPGTPQAVAAPVTPVPAASAPGFVGSLGQAFGVAAGTPPSRRVLLLFSGPYDRPDGIAAFLLRRGVEVDLVDAGSSGGGEAHDVLNDSFFATLYEKIRSGHYAVIFAAPPCSSYSVARFFNTDSDGPPVVRDRDHILGVEDVPAGHKRELHRANEITRRTAALLGAALRVGADIVIENPSDRGDQSVPWLFQEARHGPIWLDPHLVELWKTGSLERATFAQCMFGAPYPKYTTLWFSAGLAQQLQGLNRLLCTHAPGTHEAVSGGVQRADGTWNSADAAAYPADFNLYVSEAILARLVARETPDLGDTPLPEPPKPPAPVIDAPAQPPPALAASADPAPVTVDNVLPTPTPADAADASDEPPVEEPPLTLPSSPSPRKKRQPAPVFQRGLGGITLRPRGANGKVRLAGKKAGPEDPSNHADAMRRDATGWGPTGAEGLEIDNHENNHSWSYVPRASKPFNRNVVKLTWVYKVKRDGRKKARLCVQGCTQRPGVDFDQTYCAAMRAGSLRLLSSLAARLDLQLRRWDFVAAYLQGDLQPGEVVYCSPPPGYSTASRPDGSIHLVPALETDGVDRLCRVEKPVYGMAQAGRRWQRSIFPWISGWNAGPPGKPRLRQSIFDSCVFYCHHVTQTPSGPRRELLLVGCYVDDLYMLSSHTDEYSVYHQFTTAMSSRWDVEDEGEVSDLLSVEITKDAEHVTLRQRAYIDKLMATYAPDGTSVSSNGSGYKLSSHPVGRTPADSDLPKLVLEAVEQDAADVDPVLLKDYQSLTGALLYCAVNTRPDVSYAVGLLCRAMGKPTVELYEAAIRVLFYLHWHRDVGLRYGGATERDLSGMSDSDWAVRHSTSGYIFLYNQAAISWGSKRQTSVALSSCEAEIVALNEASKECVYLNRFLDELGFGTSNGPPRLATDNSAARDLSYNPEHHEKVKHVERRHFYVRELVEEQQLVVPFVSTVDNMADFFTKPLEPKHFFRFRNQIMNVDEGMVASARRLRRAYRASRRSRRVSFAECPSGSAPIRRAGGCRELLSKVPRLSPHVSHVHVGCHPNVDSRVHISMS